MGPMPDHQWDGTKLRIQNPDGTWGPWVDLKGQPGIQGFSGGGGGGGLTKTQALQLQTLLDIFGGWISEVPAVTISSLTADLLVVTAVGEATGFYASIPGNLPVDAGYEWDWGDGSNSSMLEASHTYAEDGTYTVAFRAKNHIGWSDPVSQDITVSSEAPIEPDPYWEQVVLLLQGDSLEDAKGRHILITHEGTVTSADGLLQFDGASSLRVDNNLDDFTFPGSFTIEGQIDGVSAGAATAVLLSVNTGLAGDWEIFTRGASNFNGGFYATSGDYLEPSSPAWITDSLHSFAYVYDADAKVSHLYLDGTQIGSNTNPANDYLPDVAASLFIGRENAVNEKRFKGGLTVRITNGVARYTGSTYTPPTWPLPTN